MADQAGQSPCADLVPAVLALPWHEMDLPPAGDPVPELDQELPDQEEPAEPDDDGEGPEPEPKSSESSSGKPGQSSCSPRGQSPPLCRAEAILNKEYKGTLQKGDLLEFGGKGKRTAFGAAIGAAIGIGVAVIGAPAVIQGVGFTETGIKAGSFAAKMMSKAAKANGGGVAAGSPVARLQSAGVVGLPRSVQAGLSAALGSVGAAFGSFFSGNKSK